MKFRVPKRLMFFIVITVTSIVLVWVLSLFDNSRMLSQMSMTLFPKYSVKLYAPWHRFFFASMKGFLHDVGVAFGALFVSSIIGILLPLVSVGKLGRLSKYYSLFLTMIPYFIVLTVVIFKTPIGVMALVTFTLLGAIIATRLSIIVEGKLDDVEKDDYVIFLMLSGKSRFYISAKYSLPVAYESIFTTLAWNFTTALTMKIFLSFIGIGIVEEISLGGYFRMLYENFNALALIQKGDPGVFWAGFSRYLPGMVAFIAINWLVHEDFREISRFVMKKLGVFRVEAKKGRASRQVELRGRRVESIGVRRVFIRSKATGEVILDFDGEMDFSVGDSVLIVGESGVGKTLFVSSVSGMLRESKLETDVSVFVETNAGIFKLNDTFKLLERGLVEYIPQNPRDSFDKYTKISRYLDDAGIYDEVREVLKNYFDEEDREKNPSDDLDKYPSEVSDGVLQVINFAIAFVKTKNGGKVLVMDEPTASLSEENIRKALNLLKREGIFEKNIVFWIDHDPGVVRLADFNRFLRVRKDERGAIVEEITSEDFEKLLEIKKDVREVFEKMKSGVEEKRVLRFKVDEIIFGKKRLKLGVERDIKRGGIYFIVGDNGAGKSSLMKTLVGYYTSFKGDIIYFDEEDIRKNRKEIWKKIDVMMQNADAALPVYAKVNWIVKSGEILKMLNLHGKENLRVYQLSYGQKKRLMLARVFERRPEIIFLDEPNASLDIENFRNVVEILEKLKRENNLTILMITHDGEIIPSGEQWIIRVRGMIS